MRSNAFVYLSFCLIILFGCNSGDQKKASKDGVDSTQIFTPDKVREVTGTGKVEPEKGIVALAATSAGVVVKQFKSRGDSVRKGEPILQLDQVLEQSRLEQSTSQVATQQSEIEMAREAAREAEVTYRYNQEQLATARNLLQKNAETKQNVDDLEQTLKKSEIELANKQLAIRQAQQRLREIQKQGQVSKDEKNLKMLRAPEDGVILDLFPTVGSAIKQYDTYADFAAKGPVLVRAEVDELFANKVKTGQKAVIRLVGNTDTLATGTIQFVSPYLKKKSLFQEQASDLEDRRVREIRVTIDQIDRLLLNTKVECIISL
ncbi:HlyD family secretion protein [Larkinella bovis]|uniref:HlyD family secretion protein n=1 Tax=Larkinella bovis TaxID=683041 RepID=A0ABW0I326_9BACT